MAREEARRAAAIASLAAVEMSDERWTASAARKWMRANIGYLGASQWLWRQDLAVGIAVACERVLAADITSSMAAGGEGRTHVNLAMVGIVRSERGVKYKSSSGVAIGYTKSPLKST